ncbi:MAG: hypothetical protein M0024_08715 [Nitrospiraceae bacterium]|nr:hypothetical protein [Nitrospiraceae bacterium]
MAAEKRNRVIRVRVTESELSLIRTRCGHSLSGYMRNLLLGGPRIKSPRTADPNLLTQMVNINKTMDALARQCTRPSGISRAILETLLSMERILMEVLKECS